MLVAHSETKVSHKAIHTHTHTHLVQVHAQTQALLSRDLFSDGGDQINSYEYLCKTLA